MEGDGPDLDAGWDDGSASEVPDRIGDYEIDRVIARGAHGVVFKATDQHDLKVAVKLLKKRRDEQELETFVQLSKTVRGMPPILSSGVFEDRTYFVMPYYERRSLRFRLRSLAFPQPLPEVIRLANACTEVLGELHRHGYTHFDFKPDNLLLEALPTATEQSDLSLLRIDERLVLTDFGTTRSADSDDQFGDGTLGYAAPELLTTIIDHDPRVDVYAASATLVEAMTGVQPLQVRAPSDSAFDPDVLRTTGPLEPVLRKGLSFEPRGRPDTMSRWFDEMCDRADVVRSLSADPAKPAQDRAVTRTMGPVPTVQFSGEERTRRGLVGDERRQDNQRRRGGERPGPGPSTGDGATSARKAVGNVGMAVAAVAVILGTYWALTRNPSRPTLIDSAATGTETSDDSATVGAASSADPDQGESDANPATLSPNPAVPPLLQTVSDPSWGTPRRRLTAVQYDGDESGQSDGARFHRVADSSRSIVSPNERWILAQRESAWTIVDRSTGDYRQVDVGRWSQPTWHPTEPETILHLAEDELALLSTPVDGPGSVAADLTDRIRAELPEATHLRAPHHGEPSADGRRHAWAVYGETDVPIGFVTYDRSTDGVLGVLVGLPEGDLGRFDSVAVTKTGDSVVVAFENAYVIHKIDFTDEWRIEQRPFAYELALSSSWQDVLVVANFDTGTFGTGWIVAHNLDDRTPTRLLNLYDNANTNVHFSGLGVEKAGWVLASTYSCKSVGAWSCDRIMALNIDDGSVVDLAQTDSCADSPFAVPHAVVNRDFTRAWFNSDFGSCGEDATIVEIEIGDFSK